MPKCSSHQQLIKSKLKQCTSCLHSGFAWQEWMGLLISPQHQGSVLCLEDGYSFYKLTQRPPAHRTGRLVFGPFLFFYFFNSVSCWNYKGFGLWKAEPKWSKQRRSQSKLHWRCAHIRHCRALNWRFHLTTQKQFSVRSNDVLLAEIA